MKTETGYVCDLCKFLLVKHEDLGPYATTELRKMPIHLCHPCKMMPIRFQLRVRR